MKVMSDLMDCHDVEMVSYEDILRYSPTLQTPPIIYFQLMNLVGSNSSSVKEISDLISRDTAITTRVLKLANSSFYGYAGRIHTVSHAISVLGVDLLLSIVMTVTVSSIFKGISPTRIDMGLFWQHCILVGGIAVTLGKKTIILNPERMLAIGVLHDLGTLVLLSTYDKIKDELSQQPDGEERMALFEDQLLGTDHGPLGADLLEFWRVPSEIVSSIRHHNQPENAEEAVLETNLLYLANRLANTKMEWSFHHCEEWRSPRSTEVIERLNVFGDDAEAEIEAVVAQSVEEVSDLVSILIKH